jgi:hypothetical protein
MIVTLDGQRTAKLRRLAEQADVTEDVFAGRLLARAIDESDADPASIAHLLDGIPGAYERALSGREQGRRGETIPLDEL